MAVYPGDVWNISSRSDDTPLWTHCTVTPAKSKSPYEDHADFTCAASIHLNLMKVNTDEKKKKSICISKRLRSVICFARIFLLSCDVQPRSVSCGIKTTKPEENRIRAFAHSLRRITMAGYKPVTHVIFDLDGTILDTEEVFTMLYQSIAEKYGKRLTWPQRAQAMGRPADEAVGFMIRELNLPISVEEFHHIARTEFHEKIRDGFLGCKLKPGVERLVEHLTRHGVPLAIATSSSRESFELKTRNHRELLAAFRHSVTAPSDPEVERGKPAPDVFLVCARRFPDTPDPEQVLVIEDAPSGLQAARAAGMQVVMVPDPRVDPKFCKSASLVLKTLESFQPELFGLPPFANEQ